MFQEQRLELGLNFGATYGPRFSTAIATQSDGQEQRRAMWSQPLIVANLAGRAVDKIELDYLLDFHASVKGSAYGFRLRDWSDYKSGLTAIGTGNGTTQTWQLVKRYTVGSYTVTRPITKPVANSLTLYLNGVATATGWSLNTTTGVLTTTLTGAIAVDFEFDVPVRFAEDQIKFTFNAADPFDATRRIFTLDALTCTEIRLEPTIYPAIEPLPTSMPLFNLGYDYGTNGGPQFDTGIASTASEFEARIPYLDTPKGSWNIGDRTLDRAQVDYFLAFYRLCRGMAVPFSFKDWQTETIKTARFAEDRISLQFNAYRPHDQQVIFYLGGLAIVEAPRYSFTVDIRADYYGDNPSQDVLDGSYEGRNDAPWNTKGPYIGESIEVSFYEGLINPDLGNGYFVSILVDGIEKVPSGFWWRVSLSEQRVALQPDRFRGGILNPRGIVTATPIN